MGTKRRATHQLAQSGHGEGRQKVMESFQETTDTSDMGRCHKRICILER